MKQGCLELSGNQLPQPVAPANGLGWYNGYSPTERKENLRKMKLLIAKGELPPACGPCALCGDPDSEVEYHGEDYSLPYIWVEPATYVLCRHCHRQKLHMRFSRPLIWQAFLAHVRRGGYARDLENPHIKHEFWVSHKAIETGRAFALRTLRPYKRSVGEEWFARLRLDRESLRDPSARPRP